MHVCMCIYIYMCVCVCEGECVCVGVFTLDILESISEIPGKFLTVLE
jgi:hypothetical protein